jgi:hypothetical protein
MTHEYSKDDLARLMMDPKWYLENLVKIKGKKSGSLIPMKLWPHQVKLFATLRENRKVMILKGRQLGCCLSGWVRVLTRDRGWVQVSMISAGDRVMDADGRWSEVVAVFERENSSRMVAYTAEGLPGAVECTQTTRSCSGRWGPMLR